MLVLYFGFPIAVMYALACLCIPLIPAEGESSSPFVSRLLRMQRRTQVHACAQVQWHHRTHKLDELKVRTHCDG